MRDRRELLALQKSLAMRQAERLPLTPAITERATRLMETLALSHGLQMGDALIAATGLEHQLTVLTANTKHFSAVQGLVTRTLRPGSDVMMIIRHPISMWSIKVSRRGFQYQPAKCPWGNYRAR